MTKFYSISISMVAFLVGTASAQITLESTDMTAIGDHILRYVDTIPVYGPGGAGANQTWDFSAAVNDTVNNTDVVTVGSTPFASTFASADYAMTNNGASYLYFTHDANSMVTTGAAGDLLNNGDQIESPFSDPLILHQFPRTYMSSFDDTYAFVTEADGAGLQTPIPVYRVKLTHTGHVFDTTDAYGTLITPTGTYDALRVKSVDFTTDLLEYKLFSFSQWAVLSNTSDTSTSYSWHAKEEMLAIAEFAYDSIGNPARFTYSTVPPTTTVGITDGSSSNEITIYPQPAKDQLCLSGVTAPVRGLNIDILSSTGALVKRQHGIESCMDVSELKPGMYILRSATPDGLPDRPMKFIKE